MEDRDREGILPGHLHGLPRGWWYAYDGNPHAVEPLIPAPMRRWEHKVLPEPSPCEILGISAGALRRLCRVPPRRRSRTEDTLEVKSPQTGAHVQAASRPSLSTPGSARIAVVGFEGIGESARGSICASSEGWPCPKRCIRLR